MTKIKNILATCLVLLSLAGIADTPDSPVSVPGSTVVTATEAKSLFDEGVAFIDVRKDSDFEAGRIPGAIHIALDTLTEDQLLEEVDRDEKIVFYCNGVKCLRSSEASKKAVDWGFTQVFYFRKGLPAWATEGYNVE